MPTINESTQKLKDTFKEKTESKDTSFSSADIPAVSGGFSDDRVSLYLPFILALLSNQKPDTSELEKEVAYLRGKVDVLEKITCNSSK